MARYRFGELIHALPASSTRRAVAGALLAGFLSLVSPAAGKQRRRRKPGKRKRKRHCPSCRRWQANTRRCVAVADGVSCGECLACHQGACAAISDGVTCPPPARPVPAFCYTSVPEIYRETNVLNLIAMQTTADFEVKRKQIIDHLWKGAGLPAREDVTLLPNVTSPVPDVPSLAAVDELVIQVGERASHVAWFRADAPNGRLALYHAGHSEHLGESGGDGAIRMLLALGFDVLGFLMPGFGPNTPLAGPEPRHQAFAAEETAAFSPLVSFLEPIAVALNAALSRQRYTDVTMLGISGGGWTTTVYAAIDPRIRTSFEVAGSLPAFLREAPCSTIPERGDWEQHQAALYQQVDYTQLYVLGAAGQRRRMIQVVNQYDSCCFWGLRYQAYEHDVAATVTGAGPGAFGVWLDSTTRDQHVISAWALDRIAEALQASD